MLLEEDLVALKLELSAKAKNGLDFIVAASIIWSGITFIWTLPYGPAHKGYLTFFAGGIMLPMAFLFSKIFKTIWTIKDNPLQRLGLWLKRIVFYCPFLIFIYVKQPQYFIMTYAIITGAHFFPYAWFYNVKYFAIMAGIISVGCLIIGFYITSEKLYLIPAFMVITLLILAVFLFISYRKNVMRYNLAIKKTQTT